MGSARQGRRARRAGAAVAAAAFAGAGVLALAPAPAAVAAAGQCTLVELPPPTGGFHAGVMDIEVVDGVVTYYGNFQVVEADGMQHQRAVAWRGLDGPPEVVDPGLGAVEDIAYELTPSGLVNGESWSPGAPPVSWVHDLATGTTTVVDPSPGDSDDRNGAWVRRVNSAGELSGSRYTGNGGGGMKRANAALAWDHYTGDPRLLHASGPLASAIGINEHGDRSGFVGTQLPGVRGFAVYTPTIWRPDGSIVTMDTVGTEAVPFLLADDGSAAGDGAWGYDIATSHYEAIYWPAPDDAVGLGVLDGGAYSRAFGLDEGGWAVGAAYQWDDGPAAQFGEVARSFLYRHGVTTREHLEILPTLWSVATGVDDWTQWYGTAVHAANAELDQVASGSHSGYTDDGRPTFGATVYLGASACGVEVATTHDPFGLGVDAAVETATGIEDARATSDTAGQSAVRGGRRR